MKLIPLEDSIHEELSYYRKRLSDLKKETLELQESVEETIEEICQKHFKELSDELEYLDKEIQFEEIKQNLDFEEDEPQVKRVSDKDLKKIFYLVAKYSHPDKVGDKFIEEFKTAQEAYKNGDIDTLEEILEIVSSDKSPLNRSREDAEKTLERLKESIREEEEKLQKVMSSYYAKIIELYNSEDKMTNLKARHSLSDVLFKSVEEKTERLNQLKKSDTI
jgi:hypothetical protein